MIALTLTNFAVLYVLLFQNARRIVVYALGYASGNILSYFLNPGVYAAAEPWKFGYGFGVTLFLVLVATLTAARSKGSVAVAVMLSAAALNLYEGSRGLSGECFVAAAYLLAKQTSGSRSARGVRIGLARALIGFAFLALSGFGILRIYEYTAENGVLGGTARWKYEAQSSGRYGVLLGGRGDFLVGLEAALDSPIVGHGSWAKDWRYASQEDAIVKHLGYRTLGGADSWLIPTHSHLVGAWVYAGILGAIFWVWVLSLPLRALRQLYAAAQSLSPLIAFLALVLIWDVLFSPYGAERRYITPYYVVLMMSLVSQPIYLPLMTKSGDDPLEE
jgi:hypothetical protein